MDTTPFMNQISQLTALETSGLMLATWASTPSMTTNESLLAPAAADTAVPNELPILTDALSAGPNFQARCEEMGRSFDLHPFALGIFLGTVAQLLPTLRPEPPQERLALIHEIMDAARGQTLVLGRIGSFLVGDDWRRRPYRSRQTFFEAMDIALTGLILYTRMKIELPEQPVFNLMGFVTEQKTIGRISIPGTPYRLELATGTNESHAGFKFVLLSNTGESVARIGVQVGSQTVSVVQMQGGGKNFGAHRDRLRPVLGDIHPFDWLLRNLAHWSLNSGRRYLRGCGYRLNSSLDAHFRNGEFAPERRPHFSRLYDDRFLSFGMERHGLIDDVFEMDLLSWEARKDASFGETDTWITQLMEQTAKP